MSLTLWSACTGAAQSGRPGSLPGEELEVREDSPAPHSSVRAEDTMCFAPSRVGLTCSLSQALSVGIFPYVLKLLQSSARELRPLLVFIWAKILAVDSVSNVCLPRSTVTGELLRVGRGAWHCCPCSLLLASCLHGLPPSQERHGFPGPGHGLSHWPSAHLLSLCAAPSRPMTTPPASE